jgi:phospholipid transport system substrate-binding protein
MLKRRNLLSFAAVLAPLAAGPRAWAEEVSQQQLAQAAAFIAATSKKFVAVLDGPEPLSEKQAKLQEIVDSTVDVTEVGKFCLGRFWRVASPAQQREYLDLFHRVLMQGITGKVGEYRGVSITIGRAAPREGAIEVTTTINRPNNPPSNVNWLVSSSGGSFKIIDVIVEGTSLRLTQRSDYYSYLSHNNDNVQALIDALKQQAARQS